MTHTSALYIPRRMDQDYSVEEQVVCVCGLIFKRERREHQLNGQDPYLSVAEVFAEHLKEANYPRESL